MYLSWFIIVILITGACTWLFSFCLVNHYTNRKESACAHTFFASLAIAVSLLCIFLIPVDVYSVSSNLTIDGAQADPSQVSEAAHGLKFLYYILYAAMLLLAFIILPFSYFYFEEEVDEHDEDAKTAQCCGALKYTLVFVAVFAAIVGLSFILKKNGGDTSGSWQKRLADDFGDGDQVISFATSFLALLGMLFYVIYVPYGLAMIPIGMMRSRVTDLDSQRAALLAHENNLANNKEVVEENQKYLNMKAKYSGVDSSTRNSTSSWGYASEGSDRAARVALRKEQRKLDRQMKNVQERQEHLSQFSEQCVHCWNGCFPIRLVCGLLLLVVSLLIVTSISLNTIDKFLHSTCKLSCGYILDKPTIANPIDVMLTGLSPAFPLDLIFFSSITVYLYIAAISGMVALGVRLIIIELYPIKAHSTAPNGMTMAAWILMFVCLVANSQIISLMPQYTAFGEQFYMGPNTAANVTLFVPAQAQPSLFAPALAHAYAPAAVFVNEQLSGGTNVHLAAGPVVESPSFQSLPARLRDLSSLAVNALSSSSSSSSSSTVSVAAALSTDPVVFVRHNCDLDHSNVNTTCVLTQMASLVYKTNTQMPFFGSVQFFANVGFLLFFIIFTLYGVCRSAESFNDALVQSRDPDAANYVPS